MTMRLLLATLTLLVVAVGCTDEPELEVTLDDRLRFDNIVDARAELTEAEGRWATNAPDAYVWRVTTADVPDHPAIELSVVDGIVADRFVADHAWDVLPRSPEEAFALVDRFVSEIEDDPSREGDWSECTGHFFSFGLHPEYGVPIAWGDSDPCADVVGVSFDFEVLDG